ncbi:MAG TPA: aminopeptidase [Gaiellaceae bacterium]|nr:aminopeptidase [Gaiellaceae bacterium]
MAARLNDDAERLEGYAELAVRVGANVQPGQEVFVFPLVEHVELGRALVRQAYKAGASYVHTIYRDDHVRHALIGLGPDAALTHSPEWEKQLMRAMEGNAQIGTMGRPEPQLLADLDGERIGRAIQVEIAEIVQQQHRDNSVNWCGVGAPNEGWARQVFGEPDVERLWEEVAFCMRLDEPDPVAAWREQMARLDARAAALTALRPDALRYRGPGTDLTVGLFSTARWGSALFRTSTGIDYVANLPTEEIFTTPDPRRAEGTIRSSMPLSLGGQIIRGLELTFEDGRIVGVDAEEGADLVRSQLATNENADRLGEVALVTKESRVGRSGTLFFDTLFDENAACHIAYGMGLAYAFEGEPDPAINVCNIHIDFMVGAPELEVDAVLADGTEVPLIRGEEWQLPE